MKLLRKYILFIMAFGFAKSYAQQTMQFSQYMFNGLVANPAYAGYKEEWTINLSSRLQWTGVDGTPKTNTLSIDGVTNADKKNIGLGFLVSNDRIGPQNTSSAYINYAYRIRLDNDDSQRLSFGIAAGIIQYSVNGSLFNAVDGGDAIIPKGNQSKLTPDFRAGIYYYSSWFYLGASMLNLLPVTNADPSSAIVTQVRNLYLTTGFIIPISSDIKCKPSVMFKEDFKGPTNLDAATYFILGKSLWVGAGYSTAVTFWKKPNLQTNLDKNDAVTAIVIIKLTPRCRIGYSYDFATSQLIGNQGGSHEVSFSLSFGRKNGRILSPRYF